jgi:hypothetical protein
MIIGSLAAVPASLALEPSPPAVEYLTSVAGVAIGLVILAVPWDRLPDRALYAVSIVAAAYVTVGAVAFSDDFGFYMVLVGIYTAYAVAPRREFVALMALFTAFTLAQLLFVADDESFSAQAHLVLVALPVLYIAAGVVRYLREALADRERHYRRFAFEAVALAERIRGGGRTGTSEDAEALDRDLAELASRTRGDA